MRDPKPSQIFVCLRPFVWLVLLLNLVATSEAKTWNVAVNDLAARGIDTAQASIISDRFRTELMNTGRFRVMERGQMNQILKEQAFAQSGACDQSECALEIGKLLAVDHMVVGAVGKLGAVFVLQARVLDVGTGEIVFSANQDFDGKIEGVLTQGLPKLAERLAAVTRTDSAPGKADLYVHASDSGAEVTVDGVKRGVSPMNVSGLSAGDHRVEVRKGKLYGMVAVELRPDDVRRVEIPLEIESGSLKLFSDPAGAEVLLDGSKPLGKTPLKAEKIASGRHLLEWKQPGYLPQVCTLEVQTNTTVSKSVAMVPGGFLTVGLDTAGAAKDTSRQDDSKGSPIAAFAKLTTESGATIEGPIPLATWLRAGSWQLVVEGGPDWEVAREPILMGASPLHRSIVLAHSKRWNDSMDLVHHQETMGWVRTLTGAGALGAVAVAVYSHLAASSAEASANQEKQAYGTMGPGSDFEASKARYRSDVKRNQTASQAALIADITFGLLATVFGVSYAF